MNEWLDLSDGGWWHVAGWTMLHFLWLGTLVGLAAGVCRLMLRRAPANVRYVAALICFVALAALPIGIGVWLATNQQTSTADVAEAPELPNDDAKLAHSAAPGSAGGIAGPVSADQPELTTPIISREPAIETNPRPTRQPGTPRGLTDAIAVVAGYLPWAWLTGTPLTFLLLTTGVVGAERLRRSSRILDDGPIAEACAELARSLRIGREVTVAVCERIAAPVLVGIVRPMILLPSSALTGWSPEEIEMVLLHELAHVRRWDNLVNLVQRFVEAALFFHPAVWLVSRWVRAEREACCDAVVVGRTNRPTAYAAMLIDLAELASNLSEPGRPRPRGKALRRGPTIAARRCPRPGSLVSSAMAAGPLRSRIQRILALDADPMLISGKSLGVVMSGLLLAATLVVLNLPTSTRAEDEPPTKSISADNPTLVDVPFEVGATKFADGDEIKITAIRGTANTFKPGNEYWIKGTFTLRSRERATLGASVTAPSSAHAITPHDPDQSVEIVRGFGEFTLKLPMRSDGWPHVSFYPADRGQSFGGVYFGTGDNLLQEWWKDSPESEQNVLRSKFVQTNDNPLETQVYRINNAPNAILRLEWTTKMLERQPSGPKVVFGYNWRDDFTHLEIVTPKAAQEFLKPQLLASQTTSNAPAESAKFPSLEDQKLADLAWKRLGVELEAIDLGALQRVKALGYEGGLKVTPPDSAGFSGPFEKGDILVGLHVWPTTTLEDVRAVLNRDDLGELSPLKFYVIRPVRDPGHTINPPPDKIVTGRIQVKFDDERPRVTSPPPEKYSAQRSDTLTPQQMAEMVNPQMAPSNAAEVAALRQHVEILERQFKKVDEQFQAGAKHVGPMRDMTAFELALSQAELLLAEGSRDAALDRFKFAGKRAEDALQSVTKEYEANRITQDVLLQAARNATNVKRRILQLEQSARLTSTPAMDGKEFLSAPTETNKNNVATETPRVVQATPMPIPLGSMKSSADDAPTDELVERALEEDPNMAMMHQELMSLEYELTALGSRMSGGHSREGDRLKALIAAKKRAIQAYRSQRQGRPAAAASSESALRYNGKTFEEWRTAWQTELSLEKRLEVVKALAAFGASGRGKEAAEAILDVANQLDWSYIQDSAKGRLQQACIDAFTSGEATDGYRIPSAAWFPLIVPIFEKSGDKFTFASYLVNQLSPGEKNLIPQLIELTKHSNTRNWAIQGLKAVDPQLEDERVLKCFREALGQKGQTPADVQMLIYYLSYPKNPGGGRDQNTALRFVPELEPFLFDADEGTRRKARLAISWIQPADARELVKRLSARLDNESDKDRTEVIRALAAIGAQALPAENSLEKIALSSSDPNRYPAAVALERIRGNRDDAHVNLGINLGTTNFAPFHRQLEAERSELFPDGNYPPREPMFGGGGGIF